MGDAEAFTHELNFHFGKRGFDNGNPSMSPSERKLFRHYLRRSRFFLEFGACGSTLLAVQFGIPKIVSVESNPDWCDRLRDNRCIAKAESTGQLKLCHVDVGPVGSQGRPIDRSRINHWPNYYTAIWSEIDGCPDVVLIDGRLRLQCAREAAARVPRSTAIIIHDYWSRRRYHPANELLECEAPTRDLAVFRVKQDAELSISLLVRNSSIRAPEDLVCVLTREQIQRVSYLCH